MSEEANEKESQEKTEEVTLNSEFAVRNTLFIYSCKANIFNFYRLTFQGKIHLVNFFVKSKEYHQ